MSQANDKIFSNWADLINKVVEAVIVDNLNSKAYDHLTSGNQISNISHQIIEKLTSINQNFKYVVSVTLLAKGSNGLNIGGLSYWNTDVDGSTFVRWENKCLSCIVSVYGIAI